MANALFDIDLVRFKTLKSQARKYKKEHGVIRHVQAQNLIARQHGFESWKKVVKSHNRYIDHQLTMQNIWGCVLAFEREHSANLVFRKAPFIRADELASHHIHELYDIYSKDWHRVPPQGIIAPPKEPLISLDQFHKKRMKRLIFFGYDHRNKDPLLDHILTDVRHESPWPPLHAWSRGELLDWIEWRPKGEFWRSELNEERAESEYWETR